MAVSLNKTENVLPLFKIALEANLNQGQFWLSIGLAGDRVDELEAQLKSILLTANSELLLKNNPTTTSKQLKIVSTNMKK